MQSKTAKNGRKINWQGMPPIDPDNASLLVGVVFVSAVLKAVETLGEALAGEAWQLLPNAFKWVLNTVTASTLIYQFSTWKKGGQ